MERLTCQIVLIVHKLCVRSEPNISKMTELQPFLCWLRLIAAAAILDQLLNKVLFILHLLLVYWQEQPGLYTSLISYPETIKNFCVAQSLKR